MQELTRIDTHQHVLPPFYARQLRRHGIRPGGVQVPSWSRRAALRMMDHNGIRVGVLSVSDPGARLGGGAVARRTARDLNEYLASLVEEHPGRFGFFATLTLPDVEGALEELGYACDELHADGVVLLANAAGRYLGDPLFTPLLAELDRRGAAVFVHPGTLPADPVPRVPAFTLGYLLDTSRTAVDLILSGALERFPGIRFILAHGGGFVPYCAYRILLTMIAREPAHRKLLAVLRQEHTKREKLRVFRRFYWDTALTASPAALPSLFEVADPEHITFGTDWPFAPRPAVRFITRELDRFSMPGWMRDGIDHGNALRLFPRIRALADDEGWFTTTSRRRRGKRTCRNR
mgnify:FL=1